MGRLVVRVQPGARRPGLLGWYGDLPRIAVTARPVDGAANQAVSELLAEVLAVKPRCVHLVGGGRARTKRFEIDGLTTREVMERVEAVIGKPGR